MANSAVVGILRALLTANTAEFDTAMKRSAETAKLWSRDLKQMGAQATQVGAALTKTITLPLAAMGVAGVKAFADFDDAMTKSTAIMGGVSKVMRDEMSATARAVAKDTTFSAKEAADAYFFLASAGLDATQSMEALPRVAQFAQAGNFNLARATDLLTDAQSALGLTVRDDVVANMANMIRVSDVLVKANTLANATVEQFSESLTTKAGAALRLVNKDVEEGVAVLAVFADQGTKGAEAGDRLNIVLRDLQTAAIKNRSEFDRLNITVFDSDGNLRNMADIVGDLEGALAGMSDEQRRAALMTLGFQDRSVAAIASLIGFSDAIRGYETQLRSAGGVTEEVARKQLESLRAKAQLLWGRLEDLAISIGARLAPAVEMLLALAEKVVPVLDMIVSGFSALPAPVQATVIAFLAASAAAGPLLWAFGQMSTGAATLVGAFVKKGVAARALNTTMGLLTAATTVQAAEAVALATSWDRVRGAILAAAAATKTGIVAMLPGAGAVALVGGAAAGVAVLGSKLSELGGISDQTNQRLSRMNYTLGEGRIKTEAAAESLPKVASAFEALASRGLTPSVDAMAYLGREAELLGGALNRLPITDAATQTALWRQELADVGREVSSLTTEQRQAIDVGTKLGKSTKEMAEALGLSELAITRHTEGVKAAVEAQKKWLESIEYVGARMTWFATGPGTWVSRANWELKGSVEDAGAALHDLVFDTDIATRAWGALPKPIADSRDAIRGVRDEIEARSWMTAFTRWLEGIPMLVRDAFTGGGGLGGALRAAVSTFGSMGIGKLFELNLEDGKVVGGGAIGKALANVLPSSMASMIPGLGAAIGSLAGPAVKAIAGLFTDTNKQKVEAYNAEIKKLQESFFATHGPIEQSERLARALGMTIQGELGHQGKAGLEATKRVFEEFEGRLGRVREEMARLSKDGGLASDELIRFRDAMRDSAEVVEFVRQQTTAGAASIKAFLDATTLSTQEGATAAAAVVLAAWDGTAAGLRQLSPTIDALRRQLEETGFTGGAAFEEIAHLAGIVADETAGPMLSGISAATGAISAMHNAGLLTDEMFQGLSLEVVALRDQLLAQGHDAGHVHRLMQKDLQVLWELTTDHGMAIDETTQAMLDEAEASGIVGDKFRSSMDRMIAAVERMADVIEDAFGRKLPAAAEAGAAAAGRAIDGLASRHVSIPVDFVPSVAGFDFGGMEIPIRAMADGGIAMRTIFAAGEAGPEVIAPLSKLPELLPDRGGDAALFPALQREIRGLRHAMERQVDELRYALKDTVLQGIG